MYFNTCILLITSLFLSLFLSLTHTSNHQLCYSYMLLVCAARLRISSSVVWRYVVWITDNNGDGMNMIGETYRSFDDGLSLKKAYVPVQEKEYSRRRHPTPALPYFYTNGFLG